MLENWCYDTESLKILSSHFETGNPISDEMIDRIIKAKNVNAAVMNLRQLFFGIFDMTIHTSEGNDEEPWHPMLPLLTHVLLV
jgi:saccharolysin/metallopeptidase MepB